MPSLKISKRGKALNPIANKILITNSCVIEIDLDQPEIVTEKRSFCIVTIAEHYVENIHKYGCLEDFIKIFSGTNVFVEILTSEGKTLGIEVTTYFKNQLKLAIKGLIVLNSVRDDTFVE
ncbi:MULTISPECIES: hypothetical protein [Acinetobacter]|uniref:Uncharacterized protein n=1 Tax=Acinetobacter chengduensis TaxID=2420890 RepID=A0ABX9TRE8_9GAMM|nr:MULTISPECIES: hypothetical protein [Acinetobacter]RKG37858.1 hypothetical protein D7V31_16190 [Acinetobacter sp. WCHAc060007]RLL17573.1 hypothetical protein D9K81_17005 [Acinetobacter chengduensis]